MVRIKFYSVFNIDPVYPTFLISFYRFSSSWKKKGTRRRDREDLLSPGTRYLKSFCLGFRIITNFYRTLGDPYRPKMKNKTVEDNLNVCNSLEVQRLDM